MKPNYISDSDWQLVNNICTFNPEEPYLIAGIGWHETHWGTIGAGVNGYHLGFGFYPGSPMLAKVKGLENQLKYAHKFIVANFVFPVTLENTTEFAVNHWKSSVPTAWAKSVYSQFENITKEQVMNIQLTKNISFRESWSTKVINGIEVKRQVPPIEEYMPEVVITAEDGQIIRDRLNEVYGSNPGIGNRNKLNEIMLLIGSFWRTAVFQLYLYETKQSTTTTGDHPLGKAIDLWTPRGLTPRQFYLFIKDKCKTRFNYFKLYTWGVHCSRR